MSAIAGLLRSDRHTVEAEPAERMAAAARRGGGEDASYRSPDGRAALACRGVPLLANETHDIWLVVDGEIVNQRQLRHTLELLGHRFRSGSDAEVVLHAYEQWELDFAAHLHGAFALALWDDRRDRLVLARDRLGGKPLFVARHRGRLGFASTVAALLDEMAMPRRLDPAALVRYLAVGCVPAPATLVAGISALAPGEMLVAGRDGGPHRHRWRDLAGESAAPPALRALPPDRHAGNVRTLLECAVADRLGSDGRTGVWLTPDPASGAMAAVVSRLTGTVPPSVMVAAEDGAALSAMRALAAAAGLDPVEVRCGPAELADALPALVAAMPAPVALPEVVPAWFAAAALARGRGRAMLAHGGAGQVLLDAPAYAPLRPRGWRRFLRWLAAPARALPSPLFGAEMAGLLDVELPQVVPQLPPLPGWLAEDALAVAGLDDLMLRVTDGVAPAIDAAAQAHGLTARLPFLDQALVDYALVVPGRVRANPRVLGDLVPAGVQGRPLPAALPLAAWLAGPLGELVEQRAARWPLFNRAAVAALLAAHRVNPVHGGQLWALVVLAEWCASLGLDTIAPAEAGAELVYSRL